MSALISLADAIQKELSGWNSKASRFGVTHRSLLLAKPRAHLAGTFPALEFIAVISLNFLRGAGPGIDGFGNIFTIQSVTNANDHESQLAPVANDCQY